MATKVPLQSIVLSSAASSVTFSSIDQSYTDLELVVQSRTSGAQNSSGMDVYAYYNGNQSAYYSMTQFTGNGSSATANRGSNQTYAYFGISSNSTNNDWPTFTATISNYSNTTTYKTALARGSSPSQQVYARVTAWRGSTGSSTEAITSITLYPELSLNFAAGSTFDLYGIKSGAPQALGGDVVVTDGTYWYHAFKTTGTFIPQKALTCDYLVVAGGGGGGGGTFINSNGGGGGGAGGLRSFSTQSLSAKSYTITVGAGGNGGLTSVGYGSNGSNSSIIGTDTSTSSSGGGGGGSEAVTNNGYAGRGSNGGSGGGGSQVIAGGAATGNSGGYSPVEGYAGGSTAASPAATGSGGGGAGGVGGARSTGNGSAGVGGIGATSSLINAMATATSTGVLSSGNYYFAGGGGGGVYDTGTGAVGGTGGGGQGGSSRNNVGNPGTANTGGGGGGSANADTARTGGNGGSGIVIVRYAV